jgi:hypothetical protein
VDFEPDGALAGDNIEVVEGMDEGQIAFCLELTRHRAGVVVAAPPAVVAWGAWREAQRKALA